MSYPRLHVLRQSKRLPALHSYASARFILKRLSSLPSPKVRPVSTGKAVLIWRVISAVGSNAIQLARGAGYKVFATSSVPNLKYIKSLGASKVFDYSVENVTSDAVQELNRTIYAGIFQAAGSVETCLQIADKATADLFVTAAFRFRKRRPLRACA